MRIAKSIAARGKVLTTTNQTYQGDREGLINSRLWRTFGVSNKKCEAVEFSVNLTYIILNFDMSMSLRCAKSVHLIISG